MVMSMHRAQGSSSTFKSQRTRSSAPRAVSVVASASNGHHTQQLQVAAATLLSTLALACPVDAKVIVQQPQLRPSGFFDSSPALPKEVKEMGIPKGKATPDPLGDRKYAETTANDVDPRIFALPGAVAGIAGLAAVALKVDPGIENWFNSVVVKDNRVDGLGYEPLLKPESGAPLDKAKAVSRPGVDKALNSKQGQGGGRDVVVGKGKDDTKPGKKWGFY